MKWARIPPQQSYLPPCETIFAAQLSDLLWSDGGPQFTSHVFADFLQTWGVTHVTFSPHYPQSNGKAEATVKYMKKLISAAWTGRSVNWDQLSRALLQYRNTPCRKHGLHPHKNYLATQYKILFPPTGDPLHQSGRDPIKKLMQPLYTHRKHPRPPMINMPTPGPTFRLATMLQCRILPPKCGIFTEQSQQLDRTGTNSSKHRVIASLLGTGDLFEKEAHCQLLAPHLACQQTPLNPDLLNPAVLPALPTDPFCYQRIQHGFSAPLLTHWSLVGRCKVMNSEL